MTRSEKILLAILASVQFANIIDFMILMPLGSHLMRQFDISPQQFGLLVSSYSISAGAMGIFLAGVVDNYDRKLVLLTLFLGFTISTFACGLAPNYPFLLLARFVTGGFGGVLSSVVMSIIGDHFPYNKRATAMGFVMSGFSLATVIGVPIGLYLAHLWGWHAPFIMVGFLGGFITLAIFWKVPSQREHMKGAEAHKFFDSFKSAAAHPSQRWSMLLVTLIMMGQFSVIPFIAPSMIANVGLDESQLPFMYIFGGLASVFSGPIVGKLSDKYGKHNIFKICVLLSSVPMIIITRLNPTALYLVLTVTTIFFILSSGRMIPLMAMITATVPPQERGAFMSITSCIQHASAGLAAYIGGSVITKSVTGTLLHFDWMGNFGVACSLASLWVVQKVWTTF